MEATEEKCGTCYRKLIMCDKGHYVCTRCEKNHDCFKLNKTKPFNKSNKSRHA